MGVSVKDIYIRDPFVLPHGDALYMYGTTDASAWGGEANGFKCYKTFDLEKFDDLGFVFRRTDDFWANENFWAPEVHFYNGKFYMFASFFRKGKCRASQILMSDAPEGPFTPLNDPITPPERECLDATLYVDSGEPYIVYCHEWLQIKDGAILYQKLSNDLTVTVDEPKILFRASSAPWTAPIDGDCYITDGPFLRRLKSGKLLMLWSSNAQDGYAMGTAVSDGGKIHGPWRHISKPLVSKGGGHGMIFEFKNALYISFHSPNHPPLSERAQFYAVKERNDRLGILRRL
ncbi:MAG: glycoside hydrolase family 43 protein [Clostridiales bacterium]|nr:glycoside hydrolase family 43 protein [Clostridiales bacterium]